MALFGTDGVRGVANVDLTAELALDLAVAAAHVLGEVGAISKNRPKAIVGQDSRASGEFLEAAIVAGLASAGVDVYKVGVLPTPAIAHLVASSGADLGVMISASHNPMPDNGIKFFAKGGGKLDDALELAIESRLNEPWDRPVGKGVGRVIIDESAGERYIYHLLSSLSVNLSGVKVVVDCANGAASEVAPEVYARAGAEVIAISNQPNGLNINENCGSTHLENLIAEVKKQGADLGIAHDGDADRCLAIDADGNLVDGDYILAILAKEWRVQTVVGTVMTNLGFIKAMTENGIAFEKTPVGDRYVLENMLTNGHKLGGEQSGHIIMRNFANTGDGLLTALQLMSVMAKSKKSLKELAKIMVRFPQVLINVDGVNKANLTTSKAIAAAIGDNESKLGVNGRILLRASGTEPLVRVMVEAESEVVAGEIAKTLATLVRLELS
ncbi:MAG: phosphoglucosamine mutase [Actinobacteria bacterium]|nr:phosphoglucosamine mutase [Actinomycetota bacterium]MDA2996030.1 phosphoglucosamine mutase [Actinomycetota bacterium]